MISKCLNEQDLMLLYYGELAEDSSEAKHFGKCQSCKEKFAQLSSALDRLPEMNFDVHPATATRMATRVNERLQRPRRRWLPVTGTAIVSACALVVTFMAWTPQQEPKQTAQLTVRTPATVSLEGQMPDIEFLEDMELLMELDLLSQVEGV